MIKNLLVMRETWVRSLGWEDLLQKGMPTHSSILAWRNPANSLAGYSPRGHKELDTIELLTKKCNVAQFVVLFSGFGFLFFFQAPMCYPSK